MEKLSSLNIICNSVVRGTYWRDILSYLEYSGTVFLEILNPLKRLKDFVEKMLCIIIDGSSSSLDVYIYMTVTQFPFLFEITFFSALMVLWNLGSNHP